MVNSIWDWIQRRGAPPEPAPEPEAPQEPAGYPVIPDTSADYKLNIKPSPREQFNEWFNNL